jgi:hypothetical protein
MNPSLIAAQAGVMDRIEEILAAPDAALAAKSSAVAQDLLALCEAIVARWIEAHGVVPTGESWEGFRVLALQRQGAKGDLSFNACRETCRELVYHYNLVHLDPGHADVAHRLRLAAMVARHLALFIDGKLAVAGLGAFCCSSRPLRELGDAGHPEPLQA